MTNLKKQRIVPNTTYLSDGGLETTLIFHQGIVLNSFSAFELLNNEAGRKALQEYYNPYLDLAVKRNLHFILETPTWRANADWAKLLGYTNTELRNLNRESVRFVKELVERHSIASEKVVISGNIGPRGDGYKAENCMTVEESKNYHLLQVESFVQEGVDIITAATITYSDEAIGIVKNAQLFNIPVVISFTVETDGRLPNTESLKEAILKTDAATEKYVSHYMINCAHPKHFEHILTKDDLWLQRIKGIRANASTKSHAELDESESLDSGDKNLLKQSYKQLQLVLPDLQIIGGCCGTDHTHIEEICDLIL